MREPPARLRMAAAGLGLAFVPRDPFLRDIAGSGLDIVDTELRLPDIHYVAIYRNDIVSSAATRLAAMAKRHCRFAAEPFGDL